MQDAEKGRERQCPEPYRLVPNSMQSRLSRHTDTRAALAECAHAAGWAEQNSGWPATRGTTAVAWCFWHRPCPPFALPLLCRHKIQHEVPSTTNNRIKFAVTWEASLAILQPKAAPVLSFALVCLHATLCALTLAMVRVK